MSSHLKGSSTSPGLAPVLLFAYRRLAHLQRAVESLRRNPEADRTELHVHCDGPRGEADRVAVEEVRRYVASLDGFGGVRPLFRDRNLGLAESVISGVTSLLDRHDRVIILEDDLVLSPHFLRFMNEALTTYAGDARVASIHGYCYPTFEPLPETFFLRGADCWGWATWRRAWSTFEADGVALLRRIDAGGMRRSFDLDGAYPFARMLEEQVNGRNSSWAIRWHAACFLADKLTLYPGRSLVQNSGNDASGTHAGSTSAFDQAPAERPVEVHRIALEESATARKAFARFLRRHRRLRWFNRLRRIGRGVLRSSTVSA